MLMANHEVFVEMAVDVLFNLLLIPGLKRKNIFLQHQMEIMKQK